MIERAREMKGMDIDTNEQCSKPLLIDDYRELLQLSTVTIHRLGIIKRNPDAWITELWDDYERSVG